MNEETKKEKIERTPLTVDIAEPLSFGGDFEMELFTASELGGLINSYFKNIFNDYLGCKVMVNPMANNFGVDMVSTVLYFTPGSTHNDGVYNGFNTIGSKINAQAGSRLAAMLQNNAIRRSNMNFVPTQELVDITYPLLDRLAIEGCRVKASSESYTKSGILTETSLKPDQYSNKMISTVFMETVSIDKLINTKLTENNKNFVYRVMPYPIIDPMNQNRVIELYAIQKLNNAALRKKMEQLGLITKFNGIDLITN